MPLEKQIGQVAQLDSQYAKMRIQEAREVAAQQAPQPVTNPLYQLLLCKHCLPQRDCIGCNGSFQSNDCCGRGPPALAHPQCWPRRYEVRTVPMNLDRSFSHLILASFQQHGQQHCQHCGTIHGGEFPTHRCNQCAASTPGACAICGSK